MRMAKNPPRVYRGRDNERMSTNHLTPQGTRHGTHAQIQRFVTDIGVLEK